MGGTCGQSWTPWSTHYLQTTHRSLATHLCTTNHQTWHNCSSSSSSKRHLSVNQSRNVTRSVNGIASHRGAQFVTLWWRRGEDQPESRLWHIQLAPSWHQRAVVMRTGCHTLHASVAAARAPDEKSIWIVCARATASTSSRTANPAKPICRPCMRQPCTIALLYGLWAVCYVQWSVQNIFRGKQNGPS